MKSVRFRKHKPNEMEQWNEYKMNEVRMKVFDG